MSHSAYPTADNLLTFLQSVGLFSNPPTTEQDGFDLDTAIGAAVDEWERRSGFKPFLADTAETTWSFESDLSACIDLQGGFVSISAVNLNSVARTINRDFRTMPRNAALLKKPITYLLWNGYVRPFPVITGQAAAVTVTGLRGYEILLTDEHFRGILKLAAISLLPELATLKTDGVIKKRQGDTEYTYGGAAGVHIYSGLEARWLIDIAKAIPVRVRIG